MFITLGIAAILLFIMGFDTMLRLQGHIDALISFPVEEGVAVIGGADGPTSILITRDPSYGWIFIGAAIAAVIAAIGVYKTKKD